MKTSILLGIALVTFTQSSAFAGEKNVEVSVPAGINHGDYDRLLKKYVNDNGLVAYQSWKNNAADRAALEQYIAQFQQKGSPAIGDEKFASLINAYNAGVLEWILQKYRTESIQIYKDSFSGKRYKIGSQTVSLNDIEHGTLRPQYGYRTHAALVAPRELPTSPTLRLHCCRTRRAGRACL